MNNGDLLMSDNEAKTTNQGENKLNNLIDSIRGTAPKEVSLDKNFTLRLNANIYSKMRGLANYSDRSMNAIIGELLEVAYDELFSNLHDQERNDLDVEAHAVFNELLAGRGDE